MCICILDLDMRVERKKKKWLHRMTIPFNQILEHEDTYGCVFRARLRGLVSWLNAWIAAALSRCTKYLTPVLCKQCTKSGHSSQYSLGNLDILLQLVYLLCYFAIPSMNYHSLPLICVCLDM